MIEIILNDSKPLRCHRQSNGSFNCAGGFSPPPPRKRTEGFKVPPPFSVPVSDI